MKKEKDGWTSVVSGCVVKSMCAIYEPMADNTYKSQFLSLIVSWFLSGVYKNEYLYWYT